MKVNAVFWQRVTGLRARAVDAWRAGRGVEGDRKGKGGFRGG